MKTLKNIDAARVRFREVECAAKLKKALSEKINPNVEKHYNMGDPVFFYDMKRKEWKKGTALVRLGKTLYLRFGNFLRRVPVEKVRPDHNGEVSVEEGYAEHDDEHEERFTEQEIPVQEMAKDLELAEVNKDLSKQIIDLKDQLKKESAEKEKNSDELEKDAETCSKKEEKKNNIVEARKLKRKNQKEKKEENFVKVPKVGQIYFIKIKDLMHGSLAEL